MSNRMLRLLPIVLIAFFLAAGLAWALGFKLGKTKEQLGLKYDVAVTDHHTGRVTAVLTIADQGSLKPLRNIYLVIPSEDGTGYVDLSVPLAIEKADGKQTVRAHMKREWAERAEIQLRTVHLDGKRQGLTWYYHTIPIAEYLPTEVEKSEK